MATRPARGPRFPSVVEKPVRPKELVRLERTISDTPLARQHAQVLDTGGKRKVTAIPWSDFDRGKYHPAALKLAEQANTALASGEYGAITMFARLCASMVLHKVPLDIIDATTRAMTDELRHADYAATYAEKCAGKKVELTVDRRALESDVLTPLGLDLLMLEATAIGEALACALLDACQELAVDPVAKTFFGNLVRDEVHHARLGWYYLSWRAPRWTLDEKQAVADRAGELIVEVETRFERGRHAPPAAKKDADALGVLDTRAQLTAVRGVMEDEVVPALDALGLGASAAWEIRKRSTAG